MKKRTINGKVYVITPEKQKGTCFGCAFDGHFNEAPVCPYIQSECKNGMIFKALETEETKKSNLKPFNLEEAKAGKSVYTRDGHKARIICFDRKFYHDGYNYPIVAMVNDNDNELVHAYTQDGLLIGNMEGELDLMMLSNMWLARDKDGILAIYNTKPIKYDNLGAWGDINQNIEYIILDDSNYDLFPEIKWSDKEPREFVLKPIKEEQP